MSANVKMIITLPVRFLCKRGFHSGGPVFNKRHHQMYTLIKEYKGIRTITLNNPEQRNALSLPMMQKIYEDLQIDDSTRVVIIRSTGPVFSSGHNLKELNNKDERAQHEEVFSMCTKLMKHIQDLPVPVIAQVDGLAAAAGCQLVATCDIAVASQRARFSTPGVRIGLFCSTPAIAVARTLPRKKALEMLFTGSHMNADGALKHGLVSKVVKEDQLEFFTRRIARFIIETSKPVVALGKKFFYEQIQMSRDEAYWHGEKIMVDNLQLYDAQEGINAFIEKRRPQWEGALEAVQYPENEEDYSEEETDSESQ